MNRHIALLLGVALLVMPQTAGAQAMNTMAMPAAPPAQAPLMPAEQAFYERASATLAKLYPTPAAAEKAGYARYTNEDRTGAISYENKDPKWYNSDYEHPQQLWYDVNGRLLGADYSQLPSATAGGTPSLYGLQAARFHHIPLHVHYVLKMPDGTYKYGLFVTAADYAAAGGDPLHPTAEMLVKIGKAASVDHVVLVFPLLENYDAQIWVIPNPAGQFASANPNVKPSPNQGGGNGETKT